MINSCLKCNKSEFSNYSISTYIDFYFCKNCDLCYTYDNLLNKIRIYSILIKDTKFHNTLEDSYEDYLRNVELDNFS